MVLRLPTGSIFTYEIQCATKYVTCPLVVMAAVSLEPRHGGGGKERLVSTVCACA